MVSGGGERQGEWRKECLRRELGSAGGRQGRGGGRGVSKFREGEEGVREGPRKA